MKIIPTWCFDKLSKMIDELVPKLPDVRKLEQIAYSPTDKQTSTNVDNEFSQRKRSC